MFITADIERSFVRVNMFLTGDTEQSFVCHVNMFLTGDIERSFVPCKHVSNPSLHNFHTGISVTAGELSSQLRGGNTEPLRPLEPE